VNCQHASQWMSCVRSHKHVNDDNRTVQEERQALDCARISQAYRDFAINSVLNSMTGLKQCKSAAKWVLPHLNEVQQ
jgi:hypothetical protein